MTQCEEILEYMRENGSITPLEALSEIGCMRLASRISELKEAGVKISKTRVPFKTRYGRKSGYAKYKLEE